MPFKSEEQLQGEKRNAGGRVVKLNPRSKICNYRSLRSKSIQKTSQSVCSDLEIRKMGRLPPKIVYVCTKKLTGLETYEMFDLFIGATTTLNECKGELQMLNCLTREIGRGGRVKDASYQSRLLKAREVHSTTAVSVFKRDADKEKHEYIFFGI
jgi:hypothetical protein